MKQSRYHSSRFFRQSSRSSGKFLLACLFFLPFVSFAQTRLEVRGAGDLYPIAVPRLCVESGPRNVSSDIALTVAKDLELSGYFNVLHPDTYIEEPGKCSSPEGFAYTDWSVLGVEGLVKGAVSAGPGGTLTIRMYLHDVQLRKIVLAKEYTGAVEHVRPIAHRFANEILKFFTGISGVFGTEIAFSSKVGRFKELYVMDMDGSDIRTLTNDRGLALSASWHPSGKEIIYTTYRSRVPDLFIYDLGRRQSTRVTTGTAMELGAKFARDGQSILFSRTKGRDSDVLVANRSGQVLRQITSPNGAIDVSPDWSPDNSRVVFVSNRAGGPQIYIAELNGGGARRVSFVGSSYCTSPSWSPDGERIAYVCRAGGGYQIYVQDLSTNEARQITRGGNNEDPSWSPDGRYLAFASNFGRGSVYNIGLIRRDGAALKQLTFQKSDATDPSWGPLVE